MIATSSTTTNDTSTAMSSWNGEFIVYRGDPNSTETPSDNHVSSGTERYRIEQRKEEIEKYYARLQRVREAQWILREGPFIRYDPPQLMPVQRAVMYLKILRCNRKGIGLRMKKNK